MAPTEVALLAVSALLGGALNAVAGGGSFLTFPALVFAGVSPISANATSTAALWPGSVASAVGYRRELVEERGPVLRLGLVSAVGGLLGAIGVLSTPQPVFVKLLPFLLLTATLIFTVGDRLRAALERRGTPSPTIAVVAQLLISIYGGYFGGGMGLMMLAVFALLGPKSLHSMNALKSALGVAINASALVAFVVSGAIDWPRAALMVVAAIVGGYGAATLARRFETARVKPLVIALGWVMTIVFFVRTWGG